MATMSPYTQPDPATLHAPRPFWRKHFFKLTLLPLGAIAAVWFLVIQPRTTKTVDEAFPTAAPAAPGITAARPVATAAPAPTIASSAQPITGAAPANPPTAAANLPAVQPAKNAAPSVTGPVAVKSGAFAPSGQKGSGKATIFKQADGKYILRLEDFDVANGPDLRVRVLGPNGASLDLGGLKGNKGNQNYDLPADFDPAKWNAADVWCRTFHEQFIKAALS